MPLHIQHTYMYIARAPLKRKNFFNFFIFPLDVPRNAW
nr:MAG TPA: hypothetical protein [Caudoviricetes sp.]